MNTRVHTASGKCAIVRECGRPKTLARRIFRPERPLFSVSDSLRDESTCFDTVRSLLPLHALVKVQSSIILFLLKDAPRYADLPHRSWRAVYKDLRRDFPTQTKSFSRSATEGLPNKRSNSRTNGPQVIWRLVMTTFCSQRLEMQEGMASWKAIAYPRP